MALGFNIYGRMRIGISPQLDLKKSLYNASFSFLIILEP